MRNDTQTIDIDVDPEAVTAFVADGANLPSWAIGFAKQVEPATDGSWVVITGSGDRIATRIDHDPARGTVDFVMSPASDVEVIAWTRSVPMGDATVFAFTQVQAPEMPDTVFDAQVAAVHHELIALKALLEVSCPR